MKMYVASERGRELGKTAAIDIKKRMREDIDDDHVGDSLGSIEAFLKQWLAYIQEQERQITILLRPLP